VAVYRLQVRIAKVGREAGALLAYGPSVTALVKRAAHYVDKILRGANPADLPIEQPTSFELVVNLHTAKALGIRIPESVLQRADEVNSITAWREPGVPGERLR
jgi:ABC-type uncharacterized transport system substrate-binding protein